MPYTYEALHWQVPLIQASPRIIELHDMYELQLKPYVLKHLVKLFDQELQNNHDLNYFEAMIPIKVS